MDWFSHDWYEDDDDERQSKKMNWRALHIDGVIKNTKSRFQTKLNKVRKNKINDKSEVKDKKSLMEIKYGSSEIPWDTICPDIYQQTVLTMELHAIQFSISFIIHSLYTSSNDRSLSLKVLNIKLFGLVALRYKIHFYIKKLITKSIFNYMVWSRR